MKRKQRQLPRPRRCFPLLWAECCNCNQEFRFEAGWVFTGEKFTSGSGAQVGLSVYLCKDCAQNRPAAGTIFHDKYLTQAPVGPSPPPPP